MVIREVLLWENADHQVTEWFATVKTAMGGHNNNGEPIYKYVLAKTLTELTQKLHDKIKIYRGTDLSEDCNMFLNEGLVLIKKYMFHTVKVSIVFFSYSVRNRFAAFLYQAYPTRQQDR